MALIKKLRKAVSDLTCFILHSCMINMVSLTLNGQMVYLMLSENLL